MILLSYYKQNWYLPRLKKCFQKLKKAIKNTSYSYAFIEKIVNTFKPFYAKKPLESI